jgi:hypothetical protein
VHADEDPGLPIKFGPCSNGEYVPAPLTAVEREAIRRANEDAAANAHRLGITRASFLRSLCGAATTLLALQGCAGEAARRALGGGWDVPPEASLDAEAARAVLAGEEFVFDVQGHHLEYELMRRSAGRPFFGAVFPQVNCGADDPRACFSREVWQRGINRLITAMRNHDVGPDRNLYAELGSTWWTVMRDPEQAAHVLGKLLRYVGEDNVLWGTDCIFYGSPQDQIQAFRAFQISAEFQERYGYAALTPLRKPKVLGLNGARVYNVKPTKHRYRFARRELEHVRATLPFRHETYGPRNKREVERVRAHHNGWPG